MKSTTKQILTGVLSAILACNLIACSANDNQVIQDMAMTESNSMAFPVNKNIYEGNYISLSLLKITPDGILFEVTNKSDVEVSVMLNIALDGTDAQLWGNAPDWDIPAGDIKQCKMNGSIKQLEHKILSLHGIIFVDHNGAETFDLCDFDIGGTANYTDLPTGESVYMSEDLEIEYLEANAQGLQFKVVNHREASISVGFEELSINGDEACAYNVTTIVPHSTGIYSLDILSYDKEFFPDDLKFFEGIIFTTVDGRTTDRVKVSMGNAQKNKPTEDIEPSVATAPPIMSSQTEDAFLTATNLSKKDLHLNNTDRYEYQGFNIVDEDMEWLKDRLNKDGTVELGALYRSAAKILEGFEELGKTFYGNWGKSTVPVILGIEKPKTWDECKPYVDNACQFITVTDSKNAVLKKLEQVSCVEGTFDYEGEIYNFTVDDLSQAANEMGISETMLGYCFALLAEYGPTIEFSENSCTFSLEMWHK